MAGTEARKAEVRQMLAYVRQSPGKMPGYWLADVLTEARKLGLIAERETLGCNPPRRAGDSHKF